MKRIVLVPIVILLLAGCASSPEWSKPNATSSDLQHDEYECDREAEQDAPFITNPFASHVRDDAFHHCMQNKGWTHTE